MEYTHPDCAVFTEPVISAKPTAEEEGHSGFLELQAPNRSLEVQACAFPLGWICPLPSCFLLVSGYRGWKPSTSPPHPRQECKELQVKPEGPLLCPLSHGERGGHLGQEKRTKWKPEVYLGRLFSDATYGGTLMKLQGEFLSDNT